MTVEELSTFLHDKAVERWAAERQPYLLSSVGSDLRERSQDYRSALGEEKLKAFVQRVGDTGGFRLVQHPTQKPKVGVVPAGETFEFPEHDQGGAKADGASSRTTPSSRERIVLDFLRALGHLPEPLLNEVSIPTKVLARLLLRE